MRNLFFILLIVFVSHGQVKNEQLNLMPWPQKVTVSSAVFLLNKDFKINCTGNPDSRILKGVTRFLRRLDERTGLFFNQGFVTKLNEFPEAQLQINCLRKGKVGLQEDETYQLSVLSNTITINAATDLGALHALETLSQLFQNNGTEFYFPAVEVTDAPRFVWRGLMIDASRHFQPVDVIKRNLDGMAAMKMNVFHWHLADNQGWRIEIKKHPKLTELASDGDFYTQEEIATIVKYADERGIMVVPEIDVPGHASALLTAFPEIGSKTDGTPYAVSRKSGVHDATLDPTNSKTYQVLAEIFDEVCPLFPAAYFHIGGDENNGKEWDANPKIQEFKKKNNLATNHDLQTYFNMRLVPMLKKHGKQLMGWEEIMTKDMSKEAIIHAWKGTNEGMEAAGALVKAAKSGYKAVLSNGYYIDLMLPVDSHYLNDPMPKNVVFTEEEKARILGGEATIWSELVTPLNIDSRIWPRTAAIAERLWSNDTVRNLESMHKRLKQISFRLEEIGLTHIRSKEVILRNISNYQDTKALNDFTSICEPYKVYKRNGGGKKYFMFSPLTLFADACTADASDAYEFNKAVNLYLQNKSLVNQKLVTYYLKKWITMDLDLIRLSANAPLIQPILPLSKNLSLVSNQLLLAMEQKQNINKTELNALLEQINTRNSADVELAVYNSLKKLVQ
ncbi:beta-N-acetylhexosaminidase [Flavobacterium undicola]|uniref:beta-N-acetylhexosaminidase n=1 Tax=Flavobacterium undicola TaxID=1932779 RepID=UPI0013776EA9|nr:family 20 glycosylhydrolase [Flavobacterium undicola]MBA0885013.1 family 20 glycosylhydrolase [Flavobacterium undicola]